MSVLMQRVCCCLFVVVAPNVWHLCTGSLFLGAVLVFFLVLQSLCLGTESELQSCRHVTVCNYHLLLVCHVLVCRVSLWYFHNQFCLFVCLFVVCFLFVCCLFVFVVVVFGRGCFLFSGDAIPGAC